MPGAVQSDQSPAIRATGLRPGEHVTILADLTDGADHPWRSQAEFIADSEGVVDISKQAPVKGSYKKCVGGGIDLVDDARGEERRDLSRAGEIRSADHPFQAGAERTNRVLRGP
jgi:hypothetical protein